MTRIVSGELGGRRLRVPVKGTRPTSDRVREAIFSRLGHLDAVRDARVLDLYGGSGALALEAISRGATRATIVEAHAAAAAVARGNVADLGVGDRIEVVALPVLRHLAGPPPAAPFHLVIADPPYDLDESDAVLTALLAPGWLAPEAVIAWETSARAPAPAWPAALTDLGTKNYGETLVHYAELPA